jgi:membrane protein required for colicin V production
MNGIDLVLAVCVVLSGLRGILRGFFREAFGALALIGAIAAAFRLGDTGAEYLQNSLGSTAPVSAQAGIAFVAVFSVVYVSVSFIGFLLERLVGRSIGRTLSATGGAVVGIAKSSAVAAFILLFVYLFVPQWSARLIDSTISRGMINAAGNALRSADPHAVSTASPGGR